MGFAATEFAKVLPQCDFSHFDEASDLFGIHVNDLRTSRNEVGCRLHELLDVALLHVFVAGLSVGKTFYAHIGVWIIEAARELEEMIPGFGPNSFGVGISELKPLG